MDLSMCIWACTVLGLEFCVVLFGDGFVVILEIFLSREMGW